MTIKGLDGWAGTVTGQKAPANLTPVVKEAKAVEPPAAVVAEVVETAAPRSSRCAPQSVLPAASGKGDIGMSAGDVAERENTAEGWTEFARMVVDLVGIGQFEVEKVLGLARKVRARMPGAALERHLCHGPCTDG